MKPILFLIFCSVFILAGMSQNQKTDVLVIGGGVGGTAAGIQAARSGAKVIIIEEGPWLGGMLSAAGVSAVDGNHELPSGLWGEFRKKLYDHYGGPEKLATGWVSNTQFEPRVADSILKTMAAAEKSLTVLYGYTLTSLSTTKGVLTGALFKHKRSGTTLKVEAKQTIDATELGDVMAMAKVSYSLGMEDGATTGETVGVNQTNDIVQDLTYVAILKDYGQGRDCTIVKPRGYDPAEFDGSNTDYYKDQARKKPTVNAVKMLEYGKLPNQKYMLNWPIYGNDTYLNIVEMSPAQRLKELDKAKQQTLRFVYFIQHELGFKHLGLANEFPTQDRLALIPYHREGRRVQGIVRYTMTHIANPFAQDLYRTGISVGDYPIDHHHKKNLSAPQQLEFYPVPSYNIPLGCLIPRDIEGLIIAEKGISVSNVANGTTRLQPVVMLTGQAAGVLAALSAKEELPAHKIPVRAVQSELLAHKAYIMPYNDVKPDHPYFKSIQRVGATGILKGTPTPHAWANQTWFYPDSLVDAQQFIKDVKTVLTLNGTIISQHLSLAEAIVLLQTINIAVPVEETVKQKYQVWGWKDAEPSKLLTRGELAKMIDELFNPFNIPVDHQGKMVK